MHEFCDENDTRFVPNPYLYVDGEIVKHDVSPLDFSSYSEFCNMTDLEDLFGEYMENRCEAEQVLSIPDFNYGISDVGYRIWKLHECCGGYKYMVEYFVCEEQMEIYCRDFVEVHSIFRIIAPLLQSQMIAEMRSTVGDIYENGDI